MFPIALEVRGDAGRQVEHDDSGGAFRQPSADARVAGARERGEDDRGHGDGREARADESVRLAWSRSADASTSGMLGLHAASRSTSSARNSTRSAVGPSGSPSEPAPRPRPSGLGAALDAARARPRRDDARAGVCRRGPDGRSVPAPALVARPRAASRDHDERNGERERERPRQPRARSPPGADPCRQGGRPCPPGSARPASACGTAARRGAAARRRATASDRRLPRMAPARTRARAGARGPRLRRSGGTRR